MRFLVKCRIICCVRIYYVVCVLCVFFPSILDIKFVGRTRRGHTGGRSHRRKVTRCRLSYRGRPALCRAIIIVVSSTRYVVCVSSSNIAESMDQNRVRLSVSSFFGVDFSEYSVSLPSNFLSRMESTLYQVRFSSGWCSSTL